MTFPCEFGDVIAPFDANKGDSVKCSFSTSPDGSISMGRIEKVDMLFVDRVSILES